MSVITPNETTKSWKAGKHEPAVQLYLSSGDSVAELPGACAAGFPVSVNIIASTDWIEPAECDEAAAAVVQVDPDSAASIKRFEQLAKATSTPLIAAAYDPPLMLVRSLIRAGAHDVIPMPISVEELEASLGPIRESVREQRKKAGVAAGKVVSVIKSVGGVGATAMLTQLAIRFAQSEAGRGRQVCVLDLDAQFGDVAFQLGIRPKLSLWDLLEAGDRLDGDLVRATVTEHPSGVKVIGAPSDMLPLESLPADQIIRIVDVACREFDVVFLDLPTNWTNWSLSLVARSNLVLLVTELTVAGLHRARRQLDLLASQDLAGIDIRVIVNRFDKVLARTISLADASNALGKDVSFTIANDFPLMRAAIDRGVPISEIKRKTLLAKDLDTLDAGIAAALRLER